jgi:hypothetical protein
MSVKRLVIAGLCLAFLMVTPSLAEMNQTGPLHGTLVDVYEVSYGYNAMYGGGPSGSGNPVGIQWYCNTLTSPVVSAPLQGGMYALRFVHGRETGNPGCEHPGNYFNLPELWYMVLHNNPTAVYPQMGYDGGNTDPSTLSPEAWYFAPTLWLGSTPTAGVKLTNTINEGVGGLVLFNAQAGERLWLYAHDWYIDDNMGGVTAELWRITAQALAIDIKPADSSNTIRLTQSVVPVAILGAAGFNPVAQVDRDSLTFGRTGLEASLLKIGRAPLCHGAQVNSDGRIDLVCYFSTHVAAFWAGNLYHPADQYGLMAGKLRNGTAFYAYQSVVVVAS